MGQKASKPVSSTAQGGILTRLSARFRGVLAQSRLKRMAIAVSFALAVTYLLFPIVDLIYMEYFFSVDTVIVPSLVTATVGVVMYMLGWYLLVGNANTRPEMRLVTLWYLILGILAVVLVILSFVLSIITLILAYTDK